MSYFRPSIVRRPDFDRDREGPTTSLSVSVPRRCKRERSGTRQKLEIDYAGT